MKWLVNIVVIPVYILVMVVMSFTWERQEEHPLYPDEEYLKKNRHEKRR